MKLIVVDIPGLSPAMVDQAGAETLSWLYQSGTTVAFESTEPDEWTARLALDTGREPGAMGIRCGRGRAPGTNTFVTRDRQSLGIPSLFEIVSSAAEQSLSNPDARNSPNLPIDENNLRWESAIRWNENEFLTMRDRELEDAIRSNPGKSGATATGIGDDVRQRLVAFDHRISELLGQVGPDTVLIIVSMLQYASPKVVIAPNEWMLREGLLELQDSSTHRRPLPIESVDWSRSQAVMLCNAWAHFHVRWQGPDFKVAAEPAAARRIIAEILRSWSSQGNFEEIRLDSPVSLDGLSPPDAMFRASDGLVSFVESIGWNHWHWPAKDAAGATPPCVAPGHLVVISDSVGFAVQKRPARLSDFAPTVLELLGIPRPAEMSGRSMLALGEADVQWDGDEDSLLRDRLRGLGYIE